MPDDFDSILPSSITEAAIRSGNELVIPLAQVREAVRLASEHQIAVLGVECFRVQEDGLLVLGYSGYGFEFQGDWPTFTEQNNRAALQYIAENELGSGHGYILTTTSKREFKALKQPK